MTKAKILEKNFIVKSKNDNQSFKLEPNIEIKSESSKTKNAKRKMLPLNFFDQNNNLKTKDLDNSVLNKNYDLRMTRGKAAKLKQEERKQLDQILIDKYPNVKIKTCSVQLNNVNEQIKFLKTFGLKYRFELLLTNCKSKKK